MAASASAPSVELLYECAQILSTVPNDKASLHEKEFKTILNGVKGSSHCKRLASQFIARFFSKFPNYANQALDAIIDLCEDDDVNIRKQAIKDMPTLCREKKEFLPKTADILTQLLQTEDSSESVVVQNSLMALFRKDAKGTLIGLFSQIKNGGDEVREKAIKFLHLKMKIAGQELLSKEDEAILLEQIMKASEDCSSDDFQLFMSILAMTRLPKSVTGQSRIVELITKTVDLDKPFCLDSEDQVFKLIHCTQAAIPFFSSQVKSTKFCEYFCMNVLRSFDDIENEEAKAQILKVLAELCVFTGDVKDPITATRNVHQTLVSHLPPPPDIGSENGSNIVEAKFEFTKAECLLFAFHTMAKQAPSYPTDQQEMFKELRSRLQYFALGIQGYIRKLKEFLASKNKADLASDENEVKVIALRSANNINSLIKELFLNPPTFKTKITLSWLDKQVNDVILKRKSISFEERLAEKKTKITANKGAAVLYLPPQGKYSGSTKFSRFSERGGGGRFQKGAGKKSF